MELDVVLERDRETGKWIAEIPGIAGCYSEGDTKAAALEHLREAFQLVVEADGLPIAPQVEFAKIRIEA